MRILKIDKKYNLVDLGFQLGVGNCSYSKLIALFCISIPSFSSIFEASCLLLI